MLLVRFIAIFTVLLTAAYCQTTATLNGTIHDPSGAVVQGAEITVTQAATGLVRQALSNSAGVFRLPALPAGKVEVRIQAKGFRPVVRQGIELTVNETASIDVPLEVRFHGPGDDRRRLRVAD